MMTAPRIGSAAWWQMMANRAERRAEECSTLGFRATAEYSLRQAREWQAKADERFAAEEGR